MISPEKIIIFEGETKTMKNFKRILALVLAVMMVTACMVTANAADAAKPVYNELAISRLNDLNIFQGYGEDAEGNLITGADDAVTRAQMALFTGRVLTGKTDTKAWEGHINDTTFADIDNEASYFIGAISFAADNGIVVGRSDVEFDPKGQVSYQEALTMVVRSLGYVAGISYPNGFINKAMDLGLTDGIANVAYTAPANRGVIATILYNALYAEDSLFAEKFNLTSGTYMLVSTPDFKVNDKLTLPGASIGGFTGAKRNETKLAFAKIGNDYRAVMDGDYVWATVDQVKDDFTTNFADKLGYGFNITFEGENIAWVDECATKTFVNYGDEREIGYEFIEYNYKYTGDYDNSTGTISNDEGWFLTLGDQSYNLVDRSLADHKNPTGTEDLILYADMGANVNIRQYDYIFDNEDGDITYTDHETGVTVELFLKNGVYYKRSGSTSVVATDADIDKAIEVITMDGTTGVEKYYNFESSYVLSQSNTAVLFDKDNNTLGTGKDDQQSAGWIFRDEDVVADNFSIVMTVAKNYFCEVTAFDYDNDGYYDAAVYTPYYFGHTGGIKDGKFSLSGVMEYNTSNEKFENLIDAGSLVKNYTVTGAVEELGSYCYYLYTFNRHTNTIDVVEKAALQKIGDVESAAKGKPSANGIYENSYAKIGGKEYKLGGWLFDNLLGVNKAFFDDYKMPGVQANADKYDLIPASRKDATGAVVKNYTADFYYGWNDNLLLGMSKEFTDYNAVVLAGHIVFGYPLIDSNLTPKYDFVAFNPYQSTFAVENDQIVVDAYVDASGKTQTVKINSIDGEKFNDIEFYVFQAYCNVFYNGAADLKYSYFWDEERLAQHQATELYKNIERAFVIDVLAMTFDETDNGLTDSSWVVNGNTYAGNYPYTFDVESTYMYGVIGKNEDGSYKLGLNPDYWTTTFDKQVSGEASTTPITFEYGISNVNVQDVKNDAKTDNDTRLTVTKDTVWTILAKDGIYTYVGIPSYEDGWTLNLTGDERFHTVNSKNVLIAALNHEIDDICKGDIDWNEEREGIDLDAATGRVLEDDVADDNVIVNHVDTWKFDQYEAVVSSGVFKPAEVYLVTAKTENSNVYPDKEVGSFYYAYTNLYDLKNNKYADVTLFTDEEADVFNFIFEEEFNLNKTNYGFIITRSYNKAGEATVKTYDLFGIDSDVEDISTTMSSLADLFNVDVIETPDVYAGSYKDNNGDVVQVKFEDAGILNVTSISFVTVYRTDKADNATVTVGDSSKIKAGADVFYIYDEETGAISGYAFQVNYK